MPEAIPGLEPCRGRQAALSERLGKTKPSSSTAHTDRSVGEGRGDTSDGVAGTQREAGSGGDFEQCVKCHGQVKECLGLKGYSKGTESNWACLRPAWSEQKDWGCVYVGVCHRIAEEEETGLKDPGGTWGFTCKDSTLWEGRHGYVQQVPGPFGPPGMYQ